MLNILIILFVFIAGCAAGPPQLSQTEYNLRECNQIADAYQFTGSTRQLYLSQCVMITGGGAAYASTPMYPAFRGSQYPAIGQPDPFGPYSYRGPTWEQFNQFYSQPLHQR